MATVAGFALIVAGLSIRSSVRFYRYIKNQEYAVDAFKMYPGGFYSTMTRRQAQLILGVTEGSQISTIKQRHRLLMMNNHPDNDGSTFLATKINEAKVMLLNQ